MSLKLTPYNCLAGLCQRPTSKQLLPSATSSFRGLCRMPSVTLDESPPSTNLRLVRLCQLPRPSVEVQRRLQQPRLHFESAASCRRGVFGRAYRVPPSEFSRNSSRWVRQNKVMRSAATLSLEFAVLFLLLLFVRRLVLGHCATLTPFASGMRTLRQDRAPCPVSAFGRDSALVEHSGRGLALSPGLFPAQEYNKNELVNVVCFL